MPTSAASFVLKGDNPARALRTLLSTVQSVPRPTGALVFLSGEMALGAATFAKAIGRARVGAPIVVACGAGVLTERGELEGEAATVGLVWAGGRCSSLAVGGSNPDDICSRLASAMATRSEGESGTALVFARPDGVLPHAIEPLRDLKKLCVFGAGTLGESDVFAIDAAGTVQSGTAVALIIHGLSRPLVRSSPACRLLMPLRRITETHGPLVLAVEGERALEVLSTVAADLVNQPLVFVVLSEDPPGAERSELLLRAVQGVDPSRHGLLISEEVRPGMRMAFAVRDAAAARADLEHVVRELARETRGAAPRFGIYVNCAGRGAGLHHAPDVDVRILRSRFGSLPIVGMQSSFEIAPHAGKPTLQLYTGVFGLFTMPS